MIKEEFFVTNNHILVQFDGKSTPQLDDNFMITANSKTWNAAQNQTVIFKPNGEVVEQQEDVQGPLNCEIVAKSYLSKGAIYLITKNIETQDYYVLQFDVSGECKLLCIYENFETLLYELMKK